MNKSNTIFLATLLLSATAVSGQPARSSFDAASIKAHESPGGTSSMRLTPGQLVFVNASLRKCITMAYNVSEDRDYSISGPDWLRFEAFDITARFPPDTPADRVRLMLQDLLANRFQLKLHRQSQEVSVYALVVAKGGTKFQESAPGTKGQFGINEGRLTGHAASMPALADRLSSALFQLDRPVMDRTGLTGVYELTLNWTPDTVQPTDSSDPSLFTALQEQLGLKLEPLRAPVEVLVVDSMERRPTAN